jgi:Spy/CpxP family protein refolding chaperone
MFRSILTGTILAMASTLVQAQQSPYVGLQQRSIKALSEQDLADLRAGRGMSLALAAELNGYPGPAHVLELADRLGLTAAQRAQMQALFERMKAEAVALGEQLVSLERRLDQQFATKTATELSVADTTAAIAVTQGALRNVHLKFHLLTIEVLTSEQTRRYTELRGYSADVHSPLPGHVMPHPH